MQHVFFSFIGLRILGTLTQVYNIDNVFVKRWRHFDSSHIFEYCALIYVMQMSKFDIYYEVQLYLKFKFTKIVCY